MSNFDDLDNNRNHGSFADGDPWDINSVLKNEEDDINIFSSSGEIDVGRNMKKNTTRNNRSGDSLKSKKRRSTVGRVFLSIFLVAVITVCLVIGGFGIYVFAFIDDEIPYDLNNLELEYTSVVYAKNYETGEYYEVTQLHGTQNRIWVDASDFSPYLENAIVSIEDKRFYDHEGVDWKRTFSAFMNMFFDIYGGTQGGSTITQQLVKNLTRDDAQTSERKVREIVRARNLESQYTKSTIIECYINTVHFGNGCDGIETAARFYFGKDAKDLTLLECASLAATIQTPSTKNPLDGPDANKERREICLSEMLEQGYISQEEYDFAMADTLVLASKQGDTPQDKESSSKKVNSYFTDTLIENVIADLQAKYDYSYSEAEEKIYSGGLRIYSTLNENIQKRLEESFLDESNFPKNSSGERPQAAQTVMDYRGHIVGIIGGTGEKKENRSLNRAYQSKRQPGSSIKPLAVYAPGIENNVITYSSLIQDYHIKTSDGYYPEDSGSGSYVTVQYAVQQSLNAPAVRLAQKLGPEKCFEFLSRRFGISTLVESRKLDDGTILSDITLSSMALGGMCEGVTVTEMTAAYACFGNGGLYYKPTTYTVVYDTFGDVVLEQDEQGSQVISPETATVMNKILQTVVKEGTATAARTGNWPIFGKTGTTDSKHDCWFAGGTPYYVSVVWCGYDSTMNLRAGSNPAPGIWHATMPEVLADLTLCDFNIAEGVSYREYCVDTGLVATRGCYNTSMGYFKDSYLPACDHGSSVTGSASMPEPVGGQYVIIPEIEKPEFNAVKTNSSQSSSNISE